MSVASSPSGVAIDQPAIRIELGAAGPGDQVTPIPKPVVVRGSIKSAPALDALAKMIAQNKAAVEEARARAAREADAYANGSPAYRRLHTLKYIRATHSSSNSRRSLASLPTGSDACIEIGDGGMSHGGPNWLCYFNDVGASIQLTASSNPAAESPQVGGDGWYCNGPTTFSNNATLSDMQVSENPQSAGAFGSCDRIDGPITTTLTRTGSTTNFDHVQVQVLADVTTCYIPFGNQCALQQWDNMYVNLRAAPAPPPSNTVPERACGRCNGTSIGRPIDVATGELWNEQTDLSLSGPFGLSFSRFYGNQTTGAADLGGTHWLHTYSSRLDVSGLSSGAVTYYDNEGMPYYFTGVAPGSSSYDNLTGWTLSLSSSSTTYTLTTFDGASSSFNASGELTKRSDRVGNTQLLSRDTIVGHNDRIISVTDPLARELCFYYDGSNRITAVAAWMSISACPSSVPASSNTVPVVSLGYDTGTNCATGDLCTVTEPDNAAWTYQYATSDPTYPGNLTKVLDPLGNVEESNVYSGNLATHQESGNCSSSPCADTGNDITITYPTDGAGIVQIADGLGRASTLTFDPVSLLVTSVSGPICKCGGDQSRYWSYDSYGRVVTESDDGVDGSFKHTITYAYGRDGSQTAYPGPTSIVENLDSQGTKRTVALSYYAVGDPRQDLVQITTLPSVDQPTNVMTVSDTYSAQGLLTQRTTKGTINGGPLTAYTRAWSYDGRGRLVTETGPRTDVAQTTTYKYFSDTDADFSRAGQLQSITDALGHVTTVDQSPGYTSYTPFGDPQSLTDPNGVVKQFTYDARGRQVTGTLLPASQGDPSLSLQTTYDAAGRLTQQTLPAGNAVLFRYDTSDRLTKLIRADTSLNVHERILFTHNAFDQLSTATAQICTAPSSTCQGASTTGQFTYAYSPTTSTLSRVINADNTSKLISYTAQGALSTLNDENHSSGSDYSYAYDLAGRRLSETRALAGAPGGAVTTKYGYDADNNVVSVTDPNGNVTAYHFDDFDRITKVTSPVSGATIFTYDADNNLTSAVNANGASAVYTYDALNRVLTEADTKGSAAASETWTYDDPTAGHFGIGRLATMTDPSGSTAFTYDRCGNITVENHNVAGNAFAYGYAYDANSNRNEIIYPDQKTISYTFDFADRPYSAQQVGSQTLGGAAVARHAREVARFQTSLPAPKHAARSEMGARARPIAVAGTAISMTPVERGVSQPARGAQVPANGRFAPAPAPAGSRGRTPSTVTSYDALVTSTTYAPFGPMTSMAFGNGTIQTISYNQRYFPMENKLVAGGTTVADHVYSEDPVGNITAISDALDPGYGRSFGYDDLNRLTMANSGSKLWGTASGNGYTYDATGNIRSMQLGATTRAFTYQAGAPGSSGLPLLTSVVASGTTRSVTYDAAGAQLSDGVDTYAYGARELLGSNLPGIQSYGYDALRRRVQTQLPNGNQRASFFDDGDRLLAETVQSTNPTSIAYDYVWFGERPVAQLDATGIHWTYADHLGAPLIQTDLNGATTWQAEYEPYGKSRALRAGDVHQPLRNPGQVAEQFDIGANGATELSYNNARWYHPAWGSYTQADPIGSGAEPLYGYASDNAVSNIDFSGLASCLYIISSHYLVCVSDLDPDKVESVGPRGVFSGAAKGTSLFVWDAPPTYIHNDDGKCMNNPNCAGNKGRGPIPPGEYNVNLGIHPDFFNLEPVPAVRWWMFGARRGFELHPGSISIGCINVNKIKGRTPRNYLDLAHLLTNEMGHNHLHVVP